ncbi:hypothetical protein GCM10020295_04660 [Streptomyces cinereospinus]
MRWATPLVGVLAVTLAVVAQSWNIQFLTQAAVGASASAILPALVFALFWKKCTRAGIVWSVYAGFGSCLLLQFFGPAVSGTPGALFPAVDFAWYPFDTTGPVSIPVGFVAGWAASPAQQPRRPPGVRGPVRGRGGPRRPGPGEQATRFTDVTRTRPGQVVPRRQPGGTLGGQCGTADRALRAVPRAGCRP